MKKLKVTSKILLQVFFIVLFIKIATSFLMHGTYIFADEACVVRLAQNFLPDFRLIKCVEILNVDRNVSPMPLYSILISPIYFFFENWAAYYGILIFNSLLSASLILPIYKISRRIIKNDKKALINTIVLLFIPTLLAFEKVVMTGIIHIVFGIWAIYLYLEHLNKKQTKTLAASLVLALLSALARPYGILLLLALSIQDIINKRKINIWNAGITILGTIIFKLNLDFYTTRIDAVASHYASIFDPQNISNLVSGGINQINSLIITTALLPLALFIQDILNKKKSSHTHGIKTFLSLFILSNLAISCLHIYGYLKGGKELFLLTRYINLSIFIVLVFGLSQLMNFKKLEKKELILSLSLLVPLLFLGKQGKFIQNLDLASIYERISYWEQMPYKEFKITIIVLLSTIIFLSHQKFKYLYHTIACLFITLSASNLIWVSDYPHPSELLDFLSTKPATEVKYYLNPNRSELHDVWKIASMTAHEISYSHQYGPDINALETAQYLISEDSNLNAKIIKEAFVELLQDKVYIYENPNWENPNTEVK